MSYSCFFLVVPRVPSTSSPPPLPTPTPPPLRSEAVTSGVIEIVFVIIHRRLSKFSLINARSRPCFSFARAARRISGPSWRRGQNGLGAKEIHATSTSASTETGLILFVRAYFPTSLQGSPPMAVVRKKPLCEKTIITPGICLSSCETQPLRRIRGPLLEFMTTVPPDPCSPVTFRTSSA